MAYELPVLQPIPFLQNDGKVWDRHGSCVRCGSCCKGDPFEGALGKPVVEGMCFYFSWDESGPEPLGTCNGRESEFYRQNCSRWPGNRLDVGPKSEHPGCSYSFTPHKPMT